MFFNKKKFGENVLKCPRCKIKMEKLKKNNVVIDVCKKCHGMWLDAGEIDKLANMANKLKKGTEKSKISGTSKIKNFVGDKNGKK